MIARLLCLIAGHRRLETVARIRDTDGTTHAYLELACSRCHR